VGARRVRAGQRERESARARERERERERESESESESESDHSHYSLLGNKPLRFVRCAFQSWGLLRSASSTGGAGAGAAADLVVDGFGVSPRSEDRQREREVVGAWAGRDGGGEDEGGQG